MALAKIKKQLAIVKIANISSESKTARLTDISSHNKFPLHGMLAGDN